MDHEREGPGQALARGGAALPSIPLGVCSAIVAGLSGYRLLSGCAACDEARTGMPSSYAQTLTGGGLVFGLLLLGVATLPNLTPERRAKAGELLLFAALTVGAVVLLGIVSGVYRACPLCVGVWAGVGLSTLVAMTASPSTGRTLGLYLLAITAAAAWTRWDRTTATGLAAVLPHASLTGTCVAEVLTPDDLAALGRAGLPTDGEALFVSQCSPCAAATVGRILKRRPGTFVVAEDPGPLRAFAGDRLLVYPPLSRRTAGLGTNLYRLTFERGRITRCQSNVTE